MSDLKSTDFIALDAGFGNTRLYGPKGSVVLQSLVATNGTQAVSQWAAGGLKRASRAKAKPMLIHTDMGDYYVGPGAHEVGRPVENLDLDRMTGPETKALLYGALTQYRPPARTNLIVALPIALAQGEGGDHVKDQTKTLLQGEHTWWVADPESGKDKKHSLTIDDVLLTSQPAGAMFDFLLNAQGEMPPDKKIIRKSKAFGILSLGFNTIEMMVVDEGRMIEKHVAGEAKGVHYLLELLNPQGAYSLGELDTKLRAGRLDYSAALPRWEREVMGQIEKHWDKPMQRRFAAVFVVGGGAYLIRDALLAKFKDKLVIPDDPIISIARGCYKLALHKQG
jgi:hypothetical protein